MKSRKRILLFVLAVLAAAILIGFFEGRKRRFGSHEWFISATEGRPTPLSFARITASVAERIEPTEDFEIRLETAGDSRFEVIETGKPGFWKPTVDMVRADQDLVARLGDGTEIELLTAASSVLTPENVSNLQFEGGSLPFRFYDAKTFQQLPDWAAEKIHAAAPGLLRTEHQHNLPGLPLSPVEIGFDFRLSPSSPDAEIPVDAGAEIYDGQTLSAVGILRMHDRLPEDLILRTRGYLNQFHSSPLIVHLVVAHPAIVVDVPPETGAEFEINDLPGRLLLAERGSWFADSDELERSGETGFTVVANFDHALHQSAWSMSLVDESGSDAGSPPVRLTGVSNPTNRGSTVAIEFAQSKPAVVRFRVWPKFSHVLFLASEVPGLPAENANLENLFDARIPWVEFQDSDWLQRRIAMSLQVNYQHSGRGMITTSFPENYFPATFENTTPHDLLIEFCRHSNVDTVTCGPPGSYALTFHASTGESWADKIKEWWNDLF